MDKSRRAELSMIAALFVTALYYLWDREIVLAAVSAAAVHEAGHFIAVICQRRDVRAVRVEGCGLNIIYTGEENAWEDLALAAAGPAAGIIYAFAASTLGGMMDCAFLLLSSGMSVVYSAFNLLPAMPLDGGRMARVLLCAALGSVRGEKVCRRVSMFMGAVLATAGTALALMGFGIAVLSAAIWLLLMQNDELGIVKTN